MSKNDILTELYKSDLLEEILTKITSNHPLKEDLRSELFLILSEMPSHKIQKAYDDKYLNYLCINILKRQYHSSTSPFHKKFRKDKWSELGETPDKPEELLLDESILQKVMFIVETKLDLIDRELFLMYYKLGRYERHLGELRDTECKKSTSSFRKMEKKLSLTPKDGGKGISIDHSTIHLSHKRSIGIIKYWLEKIK